VESQELATTAKDEEASLPKDRCLVKEKAKNYIRHLRNLETGPGSGRPETGPHVCRHEVAYGAEESRLLLFMIWFTEFQRELAVSIGQVKIGKDALFEAFMTLILSSKEISPVL
jgi:hypothetical protein